MHAYVYKLSERGRAKWNAHGSSRVQLMENKLIFCVCIYIYIYVSKKAVARLSSSSIRNNIKHTNKNQSTQFIQAHKYQQQGEKDKYEKTK